MAMIRQGICRFGRSLAMANPKGFLQEVLLELQLWLTAWPLGHEHVEFEFEKEPVFLVSFQVSKLPVELPLGSGPVLGAKTVPPYFVVGGLGADAFFR